MAQPLGRASGPVVSRRDGREAADRDEYARLRDLAALARDEAADARDRLSEERIAALKREATFPDDATRALDRSTTAARAMAAADRARAAADRQLAARDRKQSELDRAHAEAVIQQARTDALTSAYTDEREQVALRHEIARANRSGEPLVLVFVTVDSDMQEVISAVGSRLRSYDPIVRMSRSEFVCGLSASSLETANVRMKEIQVTLERRGLGGSVRFALAELGPNEILEEVLQRGNAG